MISLYTKKVDELSMFVSIIFPAYNEAESIGEMVEKTVRVLSDQRIRGEIVVVNDGSTDETGDVADALSKKYKNVKAVHHRRNLGKTVAIETGLKASKGDVVFLIDADLQYSPEDIPSSLKLIEEGYDVVNGWRRERKDSFGRRFFSRVYNFMTNAVTGLRLHDIDCGFKAFKRVVFQDVVFLGDLHRYILAVLKDQKFRIGEVEVQHFPRRFGQTKYGYMRLMRGFFELISTKMRSLFLSSPMLLFGFSGLIMMFIGFLISLYILIVFLMTGSVSPHIPLLTLGVLLLITGLQSFALGFIADTINYLRKELLKEIEKKEKG